MDSPGRERDDLRAVSIPRVEIIDVKRVLKSDRSAYRKMIHAMSSPAAVFRARLVRGTFFLQVLLNVVIVLARLLLFVAVGLLILVGWKSAVVVAVLWLLVVSPVQTELNYEIVARLIALELRLRAGSES